MVEVVDGIFIRTVIFCEDVRQEAGNKTSLLGVLSADIIVGAVPAPIRLALYMEGEATKPYRGPLNLRLRLDDQELLVAQGQLNAQPGLAILPIPQMVVVIPKVGILRVDIGKDPDNWHEVGAKKILVGTLKDGAFIPSSVSEQPS